MDIGGIASGLFTAAGAIVGGYVLGSLGYHRMKTKRDFYRRECAQCEADLGKQRTTLESLTSIVGTQREVIRSREAEISQYLRLLNKKEPARDHLGRFVSKVQA